MHRSRWSKGAYRRFVHQAGTYALSARVGQCGLCLRRGVTLIESHVIPRWVGRVIEPTGQMLQIPVHPDASPGFVRAHGDYDRIVCDACERSFGPADDYFHRFARQTPNGRSFSSDGTVLCYEYTDVDTTLIQRFALTCLFRAHLSTRPLWEGTDLGPVGERLRTHLYSGSSLSREFPVILYRETHDLAQVITPPVRQRIDQINAYTFSIPGFGFSVIVDRRAPPRIILLSAIGATSHVVAWASDDQTPLLEAMRMAQDRHGEVLARLTRRLRASRTEPP